MVGIAEFVSGSPQNITDTSSNVGLSTGGLNLTGGGDGARVLVIGNPLAPPDQHHSAFQYLNAASFALPPVGVIPSPSLPYARRDFRGPGTDNWDMTLAKNIPITERVQFQLRAEAYNVFNHVSFTSVQDKASFDPSTGQLVNSGNLGALTDDRGPRILQLVGKITF